MGGSWDCWDTRHRYGHHPAPVRPDCLYLVLSLPRLHSTVSHHQTSALKTLKMRLKEAGWPADDETGREVSRENIVWRVEMRPSWSKHFSWKAFCVQMRVGEIGRVACTDSRNDDTLICQQGTGCVESQEILGLLLVLLMN